MELPKYLIAFILITFFSSSLFSQSAANNQNNSFLTDLNLTELNDENWSFYKDEENQICYIDFEKIHFNLSDIIVKNKNGDVIFSDDVLELPVNTIYEIDFAEFGEGDYKIELRSFTGIIRKEVNIK